MQNCTDRAPARWRRRVIAGALALGVFMHLVAGAAFALCADDAVAVGRLCVDKYEASVWSNPPGDANPGTQYGLASDDYPCATNGQDCDQIYAASVAGVLPSGFATWFQAQQACANVGKRLLTNAEWQMAAQGTPDGGPDDGASDCNTSNARTRVGAGTRSKCRSFYGAFDMVGNVLEWVADWVPKATACPGWGAFSAELMCFAGASESATGPGALLRGGDFEIGPNGPFTVTAFDLPSAQFPGIGFRCAR